MGTIRIPLTSNKNFIKERFMSKTKVPVLNLQICFERSNQKLTDILASCHHLMLDN